ncbi:hypothetical protein Glove_311g68 [Diversispora epigaea]|uniref:Very-long-chain (3R)-3-hydroxyacyl-CoA dehydratase n=1 Tax=Diversispora epigaea TaxID=1348612 RepID=A0A397HRG7_9GLOM|nr:hypothetical protein Glove_311g68 [Diversispora epigaea]
MSSSSSSSSLGSSRSKTKINTGINGYLILYNSISCVGWSYVLGLSLLELVKNNGNYTIIHDKVGWILTIVQTGAILEVFHVIIGFVKSPLMTTVFQVSSRLFIVWLVLNIFPQVHSHWAFTTMTIAWCITECLRYSYYVFNLVGKQPGWLLWCRYTFFYILYPLGAGSEAMLVYQSLPHSKQLNNTYYWLEVLILITYFPGFFVMYTHMISQRRKYLGGSKGKGKSKKIE